MTTEFLSLADSRIAYQRQVGENKFPGILFLGGFASNMEGTKATFLAQRADKEHKNFVRFDYRGHGKSSGEFEKMTIGDWLEDALAVLDQLTEGPQIIVGSSMGGWIGLLLARERIQRIKAFVGIATAADFTEDLIWKGLTAKERGNLRRGGIYFETSDPKGRRAPFTFKLIKEGREHLVMQSPLKLPCPVRLLHGMRDADVPWEFSTRLAKHMSCPDAHVTLIKDGDHSLSKPKNLELLWKMIGEFL